MKRGRQSWTRARVRDEAGMGVSDGVRSGTGLESESARVARSPAGHVAVLVVW